MKRRTTSIVLVALALASSAATTARADDSSVAAATVLFDEGVKLMDARRYSEACPKLARSQLLAPSGGTLLALGECYEKTGRTASAWVAYREAATRAAGAGKRDAEASALDRAKRLEPTFARIVITIPETTRTTGLEVKRDGVVVKDAELGVPVPADPGPHEIRASAPHMRPFAKTIPASAGETIDFAIPKLAPETGTAQEMTPPPGDSTQPPPTAPSPLGSTQRVVGVVVVGVGVATLITGGVFALLARAKNTEALKSENCPDSTHCYDSGITLTDQAKSRALVSTILVAVGAGAVAAGGIVFFTAPKPSAAARLQIVPSVGLGSAGGTATVVW